MNEDLQQLVEHYESERKCLQDLLDECLRDEDYEYAKYYSKNLRMIDKILFNLQSFTDYNYAAKFQLKKIISNIRLAKEDDFEKKFPDFRNKRLEPYTSKLSSLNALPTTEIEEKFELENALINLLEKENNGVKFYIEKQCNLYIEFTLFSEDVIRIQFTPFNEMADDCEFNNFFHESEIQKIYAMGFALDENQKTISTEVNLSNKSTKDLMIFLSKLFFEVLHYHSRKNFELSVW